MNPLHIEGTLKTPLVVLSPDGKLEFSGNSYPENCISFYKPVIDWVNLYVKAPAASTEIVFYFRYFNTSTSGIVIEILNQVKALQPSPQIKWMYDKEDEETYFSGQNFAELLELSFEFQER
ncbi:MAG: DUF1987 domain-containing protein [Cytophagaceae bacterium]|nr:DUF1987 domain-containing protein [Cytophagaceae bacterium]